MKKNEKKMKKKTTKKQSNGHDCLQTHFYEELRVYIHTLEVLDVPEDIKEQSILEFLGILVEAVQELKSVEDASSSAT